MARSEGHASDDSRDDGVLLYVCPICLYYSRNLSLVAPRCSNCGDTVNVNIEAVASTSFDCVYDGWMYRQDKEEQILAYGRFQYAPKLVPPDEFLLFFGTFIIYSILSGLTYKVIKTLLRKLMQKFKKTRRDELRHFSAKAHRSRRRFYISIGLALEKSRDRRKLPEIKLDISTLSETVDELFEKSE